MPIAAETVAEFLFAYAKQYREAYARATSAPPAGPGYPLLPYSPFLVSSAFDVYVAEDGVVINHVGKEPDYQWFLASGPAFKVDYEPTRTPAQVTEGLKAKGILVEQTGIYRIVATTPMGESVWRGQVLGVGRETQVNAPEEL